MSVPDVAYNQVYSNLSTHRKARALGKRLGIGAKYAVVGLLVCTWEWALHHAPDGDLAKAGPDEVEWGAGWDGEPGAFYDALKAVGFVDADDTLHEWRDYAGSAHDVRAYWRERKREQRQQQAVSETVSGTLPERPGMSSHKRRQDQTKQDKTKGPPSPPQGGRARRGRGKGMTTGELAALAHQLEAVEPSEVIDADRSDGAHEGAVEASVAAPGTEPGPAPPEAAPSAETPSIANPRLRAAMDRFTKHSKPEEAS